jgi:hypothetical protein
MCNIITVKVCDTVRFISIKLYFTAIAIFFDDLALNFTNQNSFKEIPDFISSLDSMMPQQRKTSLKLNFLTENASLVAQSPFRLPFGRQVKVPLKGLSNDS